MLEAAKGSVLPAAVALFFLSGIAALSLRPKYFELTSHFRVQYFIGAVGLGLVCVALGEYSLCVDCVRRHRPDLVEYRAGPCRWYYQREMRARASSQTSRVPI